MMVLACRHSREPPAEIQPHSQALSPLPSLVIGKKRPWLRLVTSPSGIWVIKKSVGQVGWQSVLIDILTNFVAKTYLLYLGTKTNFCQ